MAVRHKIVNVVVIPKPGTAKSLLSSSSIPTNSSMVLASCSEGGARLTRLSRFYAEACALRALSPTK